MTPVRLTLRKDVAGSLRAGHPWLYRDACAPFAAPAGAFAELLDRDGRFVASGYLDEGPIALRVLSLRRGEAPASVIEARVAAAIALRARVVPPETDAYRLIHGEGDGLPGIVVDRYAGHLVIKPDGAAAERALLGPGSSALSARLPELSLLVRRGRGAGKTTVALSGTVPSGPIEIREHGMILLADLSEGQKTGLFLDHRDSRRRVRALSRELRVLNLYGYVGGFSIAAGLGGALFVETVDVAKGAVALAAEGWRRNGLDPSAHVATAADVPARLSALREADAHFDLIVADPPSFAPSEAAVPEAIKSYRKLHQACLRLLAPGGFYLAASCSSHIAEGTFLRTLREGSEKAGARLGVLERWSAPADHPRLVAFPEGDYLKCVLTRRLA